MSSILGKWRSFVDTVDETTSAIRGVFVVVGIVAGVIIAIGKWIGTFNKIQLIALFVVLICLAFIGLTYYFDWRRKRSIDSVPELLSQLDQMMLQKIDDFMPNETPEPLIDGLAKLMGMNIGELKAAAKSGNAKRAEEEFGKFADRYGKLSDHKKMQDNLMSLRLMGGLMNDYGCGLATITADPEYQRLYLRIKRLQKRLPSATISVKVNEYFHVSEGLYNILLCIKPFSNLGSLKELIPARMRAHSNVMRPIIEGHTTTLIVAVRESIVSYKHEGQEKEVATKGK